jgi:hypothetical protein
MTEIDKKNIEKKIENLEELLKSISPNNPDKKKWIEEIEELKFKLEELK